jgi:PilZ domain
MSHFSSKNTISEKQQAVAERRSTERRAFSAEAEVVDMASGARLTVRVADISREGCYLDTFHPFTVDTPVRLTIRRSDSEFTGTGYVRNAQGGMGMGIAFAQLSAAQRALLENWIEERESPHPREVCAPVSGPNSGDRPAPGKQDRLAERLIELLHEKGLLSDSDVAFLLRDEIA